MCDTGVGCPATRPGTIRRCFVTVFLLVGHHDVIFDAGEMSSGIYLYRLQTPSGVMNRKMLLMR